MPSEIFPIQFGMQITIVNNILLIFFFFFAEGINFSHWEKDWDSKRREDFPRGRNTGKWSTGSGGKYMHIIYIKTNHYSILVHILNPGYMRNNIVSGLHSIICVS